MKIASSKPYDFKDERKRLRAKAQHAEPVFFDSATPVPSTVNADDRTVDVCWYGGASVPRVNYDTGEEYMLRLDMAGCRMDRLNGGAPVFDNHMDGASFRSMIANKLGTVAQVGVVRKAWGADGKGMATLQFFQPPDGSEGDDGCEMLWAKIQQGIIQNLSFGTWIYKMEPEQADAGEGTQTANLEAAGPKRMVATDWEPFEVSPVTVPADFTTTFLSADLSDVSADKLAASEPHSTTFKGKDGTFTFSFLPNSTGTASTASAERASSPLKGAPAMEQVTTQATGTTEARQDEAVLAAATTAAKKEAVEGERLRVAAIKARVAPFRAQLSEKFVTALLDGTDTPEQAQNKVLDELAANAPAISEVQVTRDGGVTRRKAIEASLLMRANPSLYSDWAKAYQPGRPQADENLYRQCLEKQREANELFREFHSDSLLELAKGSLEQLGISTRGMHKMDIAERAMRGAVNRSPFAGRPGPGDYFEVGGQSSSEFPSILANVFNKSLRQAYEAASQTFKAFCRAATAPDFKTVNRIQLSDLPAIQQVNQNGEFHRAILTDAKSTYSLVTYGNIVALSRKTIVNDDMQAFTRVPQLMGQGAAQMESNVVWAIITGNPTLTLDSIALFHASHSNLNTSNALALAALGTARKAMRLQTGPQGTVLNLVPKFLITPAALEQTGMQLVMPTGLAPATPGAVVPQWIQSLTLITESRLDATASIGATAWYLAADPSNIDTIEYCYLEGEQGVFMETRQGFEIDGMEIKCREDFAAGAIDFRGLQRNTA